MKHIYSTTEQKTRRNRSFPDDGIKMLNMDLNTRFNINKIAESKFSYRTWKCRTYNKDGEEAYDM
jgi:hypothetical protein